MNSSITLLLVVCAFALGSCEGKLREGVVYTKRHHDEQTVATIMPITVSTGKSTIVNNIPVWWHYPERWSVSIEKKEGSQWRRSTWWVDEATYRKARIGESFFVKDGYKSSEPRIQVDHPDGGK